MVDDHVELAWASTHHRAVLVRVLVRIQSLINRAVHIGAGSALKHPSFKRTRAHAVDFANVHLVLALFFRDFNVQNLAV